MFSDASNNYLMAVAGREIGKPGKNAEKEFEIGASFLDISTGESLQHNSETRKILKSF